MTIAPLLSIAGVAAGGVATVAAHSIAQGLSFLDTLPNNASSAASAASSTCQSCTEAGSLAALKSSAQAALAKFQSLLGPKLAELGIDLSQPLVLAVDALGGIRETSGHPQGAQVEQLLAGDDQLSSLFRQGASQSELVRAGAEHERFAKLYSQNPQLATEQYGDLLDPNRQPPQFSLKLSGEDAEVLFE